MVKSLRDRNLVKEAAESKVIVTEYGMETLERSLKEKPLPVFMNGWKYHQTTEPFWERLTLLVQVCSNLVHHESSYIPVRNKKDTLFWVKQYISKQGINRYILAERLYMELASALDHENTRPELVVLRLTGYKKIGLTITQAAEMAGLEPSHYHFEFLNTLHAMLDTVLEKASDYPLLSGLVSQGEREVPLTLSTDKTYGLIQKGYSLEEIAAARNLKQSTIEDHVVEIVLSIKGFNIDAYVSPEKQKKILQAARDNSARKLKQIKERVSDATYFEIRLVMAKYGEEQWN
ncbi:helix-turn-helix domain-containing protein [Mesobacillus subterraneus]|nr:helix-turn-helix domain-containing protein [Mesobacillus subterraneus]